MALTLTRIFFVVTEILLVACRLLFRMGDRTEGETRLSASKAQITGGDGLQLPVLKDMILPEGRRQGRRT